MQQKTIDRYGYMSQVIHWATAILVLTAFIYGPGGSEQRIYGAAREANRQLHETLGVAVLILTIIRVVLRRFDSRPEPPLASRWMRRTANVTQKTLYILLFLVPMTAISGAWLEGHPLTLMGGVRVPPLFSLSHSLGVTVATMHSWLGDVILWVAGFHAVAALFHHFVLRDGVLTSMLPKLFRAPR